MTSEISHYMEAVSRLKQERDNALVALARVHEGAVEFLSHSNHGVFCFPEEGCTCGLADLVHDLEATAALASGHVAETSQPRSE